jgi:hypothetical protein
MFGLSAPTTVIEGGVQKDGTIDNAADGIAQIRLTGHNPNTDAAYTTATGALQEQVTLTLKFTLTDGASTDDITGNITCQAVTGASYQYWNGSAYVNVPAGGIPTTAIKGEPPSVDIKITLSTSFNMANIDKVGFNVATVNDNHGNEEGEGFSVAITSAIGNECTYYGEAKATEILDLFEGSLVLTGDTRIWEGGDLSYTFTLTTATGITANNTDDVKTYVQFGGSATFDKDYTLDDIREVNPYLTFRLVGPDEINPATNEPYPPNTVEITFPPFRLAGPDEINPATITEENPTGDPYPAGTMLPVWSDPGNEGAHTHTITIPTVHDN